MKNNLLKKAIEDTAQYLPGVGNEEYVAEVLKRYPAAVPVLASAKLTTKEREWLAPYWAKLTHPTPGPGGRFMKCAFAEDGTSEDWAEEAMPTSRMKAAIKALNAMFN